ncbi:S-layer homology domain-containing protein [Paenibacillus prosopidis]|uniref:S-layer family protein n=1 Tax=Paenibacillus prosopidis TaxID=630520 RepID=A0A368VMI5_9BACL|nr:S-layer homology domain-containing protein [Paenibacillus prosopidis]RCW41661.1 S-layer family protein [Paenibacillus prosopidis]
MKKNFRSFIALTIAVTVLASAQVAAAAAFTDTKTHWAKEDIATAVNQGWINGYDATTFKPNTNMTRAEFLKSLVAAMKYKLLDTDTPFTDDTGWYRAYIATGLKQSIIKVAEYKNSEFDPKQLITREEIARMTIRAAGKDKEGVAYGYLAVAKQIKIMTGYPDGSMGGNKNATRAEAVVMITNTLKYINPPVTVAYPKTKEQLNTMIQSLPSFKGTTMYSRQEVGVNLKGSDVFDDYLLWIGYSDELKRTTIDTYASTSDIKALIKDLLKQYYPNSYEKAYSNYIIVDGKKDSDSGRNFETKYDGRSFLVYKGKDIEGVSIWIGG